MVTNSLNASNDTGRSRMPGKSINQSMWRYQPHFRSQCERQANSVMEELGLPAAGVECLLVGAKRPNRQNPHDVCVEPEDGKWPIVIFDGLLDSIETEVANHPNRNIFYGDEASKRDKPENIRQDSVRSAVQKALVEYDSSHSVESFAGRPAPVDDYYVVPVLQVPISVFKRFRPLPKPVSDGFFSGHASLIHAALAQVFDEARDELLRPDPGPVSPAVPLGSRDRTPGCGQFHAHAHHSLEGPGLRGLGTL